MCSSYIIVAMITATNTTGLPGLAALAPLYHLVTYVTLEKKVKWKTKEKIWRISKSLIWFYVDFSI